MGSNPTRLTTDEPASFLDFALWLKRKHRVADITIECKVRRLRRLSKKVDLSNPEEVSNHIQDATWSNGYKELVEYAFADWCEYRGLEFKASNYTRTIKIPYIPSETKIDQLISASNHRYASYLQFLKESGWRSSEPLRISQRDLDLEKRIVVLNLPEKNGNSRQYRMSDKLVAMAIQETRNIGHERIWSFTE